MIPTRWTYDQSLSTDRDRVRFLIQDTDDRNKILDDGEIDGMLLLIGDIYDTAAELADSLAARYSAASSITIDGLVVSQGDEATKYSLLAVKLRNRGNQQPGGLGIPFVSGISISEMDAIDQDPDREPSRFRIGQDQFQRVNSLVDRSKDSQ